MNVRLVPAERLWLLVLGFGAWCSALITVYVLHSVGCTFASSSSARWHCEGSHGAVARIPNTGRFIPGMLRQNGKLFVWDGPGNAFTYENQDWGFDRYCQHQNR